MTLTQVIALVLAMLRTHPHSPREACVTARQVEIATQAIQVSNQYHVPVPVMLLVGWNETHMGCDPHEGRGWGAPINARHRHIAGTIFTAAHILEVGYHVCGTWIGSVTRFRSGSCTLPATDDRLQYVRRIRRDIPILLNAASVPLDFTFTGHTSPHE